MISFDSEKKFLRIDCECGEHGCESYIALQKDGDNVMIYVDEGDESGTVWLSVGQLKEFVKSIDDFMFFLERGR